MLRCFFGAVLAVGILALAGCGPSLKRVQGVVKLDGNPVEGATVTFISEDGKDVYTGYTDPKGMFSLFKGQKEGIAAGTYKVTVTKAPKVEGAGTEAMAPGGEAYFKQMQKEKDESKAGFMKGKMAGPMPGMGPGPGAAMKSELPSIYSVASTTPITVKIPPDTQPIPIDLKSK